MKALTNAKRVINGLSKGERKELVEWLQSENISASTKANHLRIQKLEKALKRIIDWNEPDAKIRVDIGSNGVRDYYRRIASDALRENPHSK